jgi:hypothetical protein
MLCNFIAEKSKITYTGEEPLRAAYSEIREAIMDGRIDIHMPIGFKLLSHTSMGLTAIDREVNCMESMPTISVSVKDMLFVGMCNCWVQSKMLTGRISAGNADFTSQGGEVAMEVVDKSVHLLTAIEPIQIALYMEHAHGYKSMEENAATVKDSGYFALSTTFSLFPYVQIRPFNGSEISVVYKRGMTPELFNRVLKGE